MKVLSGIKKMFNITFALYTCLAFAIMMIYKSQKSIYGGVLWHWSDVEKEFGEAFLFALVAGAVISVICVLPKLPRGAKYALNLVLLYIGLFVWLFDGKNLNSKSIFIVSLLYAVAFAAVIAIRKLTLVLKLFSISFALYTFVSFAVMLFYKVTTDRLGVHLWQWEDIEKMFGKILIFAFVAGILIAVTDIIPKLPSAAKNILKLVLVYIPFYFWLFVGNNVSASHIIILSALYIVVFAAVAVLCSVCSYIGRKIREKGHGCCEAHCSSEKCEK